MRSAKMTKKNSEFISSFSHLNDQIIDAIAERKFARVISLDQGRQKMMQELLLLTSDDIDDELINFIDECSRKNTDMIKNLELEIDKLTSKNNQMNRAISAYQN